MTIHAQPELPKDERIFRTIVKEANTNLGAYASVVKPGEVRVGDIVEIIIDQSGRGAYPSIARAGQAPLTNLF